MLTAGYGGPTIIADVCLTARTGHLTAIVGPNGAGKSTLIKAIAGIVKPTSGTVRLNGEDVTGSPPQNLARRGMSYIPQVANVFPSLTVQENLEMGGYVLRGGIREKIEELYETFPDLRDARRRQARTLSGGQRSMLAIGRGLMSNPAILLLDEPTAGLAPRFLETVWEQIATIRTLGVAVIVVEQNTRRTLAYADWAYVLVAGKNQLEGAGTDLLEDDEVEKLYIGKV